MVASDTTLFRNLSGNIQAEELKNINFDIFAKLTDQLINPVLNRKCAILDGSGFGHYLYGVLLIPGILNFVLGFKRIEKKGKELNAAKDILIEISQRFHSKTFDLILGDGLYYSKKFI